MKKIISSIIAVTMLLSAACSNCVNAAIPASDVTMSIDISEYTGTANETFNLYVKWAGLTLSKADNSNGTGMLGYTAAVVLPEGFSVNVEDGSDPYEVYEEISENNAIYNNSYVSAKAASYNADTRTFSFNVAFDIGGKARKLYYPASGSVLLTLPVTVNTVPTADVEFKLDETSSVQFVEMTAGTKTDDQFYKSVLNGTEDAKAVRQLTVKNAEISVGGDDDTTTLPQITESMTNAYAKYGAKYYFKGEAISLTSDSAEKYLKVVKTLDGTESTDYSNNTIGSMLNIVGAELSGSIVPVAVTSDATAAFSFDIVSK